MTPRIEIHYCRQCQWLLRAAWYAQEMLTTFSDEVGEVAMCPGTGGIFQVICNGKLIWDRKTMEGFLDIKQEQHCHCQEPLPHNQRKRFLAPFPHTN